MSLTGSMTSARRVSGSGCPGIRDKTNGEYNSQRDNGYFFHETFSCFQTCGTSEHSAGFCMIVM
jgi:hypothetical protein